MSKFRLRTTHPLFEKFEELCKKADELGIHLDFSNHRCELKEKNNPQEYFIEDSDSPEWQMQEFPPMLEYRIVYEKQD